MVRAVRDSGLIAREERQPYHEMPFICAVVSHCEHLDKKLKKVVVNVGQDTELTIVTNAPNVRTGTRTVVALVGTMLDEDDETTKVIEKKVGGVTSQGVLCDSKMLQWSGGAEGLCVQVPESYKPGDPSPTSKPRMDGGASAPTVPEKSDKELKAEAKAAKKAELAAKKEARKAKKAEAADGEAT